MNTSATNFPPSIHSLKTNPQPPPPVAEAHDQRTYIDQLNSSVAQHNISPRSL